MLRLAEGIYAGLVYGLGDVYSRYYTADEYAQETASTDGCLCRYRCFHPEK